MDLTWTVCEIYNMDKESYSPSQDRKENENNSEVGHATQ
jgi:hypothetical protein